jgi:hypothetical protein
MAKCHEPGDVFRLQQQWVTDQLRRAATALTSVGGTVLSVTDQLRAVAGNKP